GAPGARGGAAFAAALLTGDALAPGLVLVPVAHFGRRGRAPALEPAATVSAGALGRALLLGGPARLTPCCHGIKSTGAGEWMGGLAAQLPAGPVRGVLDGDAGLGELVPDGVGGGVVLAGSGRLALLQRHLDQRVDHRLEVGALGP